MIQNGSISQALMNVASNSSRLSFQIQFQNIEKTVVGRLNKEIEGIVQATSRDREIAAMQKQYNDLVDDIPLYNTFLFGNEGNLTRLQKTGDVVSDIVSIFNTGDTALTAEQAAAINTGVADIQERIDNLVLAIHPDISNGDVVFRLKGLAEEFSKFTAEAGVIDAQGTDPATNDNRALYDAMTSLQSWVDTGATITSNTIDYTSSLLIDVQTELFSIESRITEVQSVDTAQVTQKVDEAKERYAQLLNAISLSYEVSSGFADYIKDGLQAQAAKPGSILNIFT